MVPRIYSHLYSGKGALPYLIRCGSLSANVLLTYYECIMMYLILLTYHNVCLLYYVMYYTLFRVV